MPNAPADNFGPAEFQAISGVSRETLARLKLFVSILQDWNARMNLVSAASLSEVWLRHVWDSAQLVDLIPPKARSLVDLGTGAGFPGLVLATLLSDREQSKFVFYESITKKCRFLEEATHRLGIPVEIRNKRIEAADAEPFDVITARACAPLSRLLAYSLPFQATNSRCLFLKGRDVGSELSDAYKDWSMNVVQHPSRSHASGTILEVRELRHGL